MKLRTTFYVLIVLSILSTLLPTTSHAQESPIYMYWTDVRTFKIQRANLDGTNVQDLVVTALIRPDGIALDVAGGKMYWTAAAWAPDPPLNKIQRANLDGTDVEDLLVNVGAGEGIAVDSVGRKMYWVNGSDDKIQRANLDGTNIEDLIITGLDVPTGIVLDVAGGKMYWTDRGTGKIQRANLDGTNIEDLITTGLIAPINIALDLMDSKMYWTDWEADKIQRANLDGTNIEDLITTGLIGPDGIALHLTTGKMYWADWGTAKIRRANLDGTDIEDLVTTGLIGSAGIALGIPQPIGPLTFNPSEIADQNFTVGTYASLTLPMATSGTPPYTYSTSALPPGLQFDPVDRWLNGTPTTLVNAHPVTYTATDATGASASLTFTITVQDIPSLTDVHMYWADLLENKIQRASLDGSNVQDMVTGFGRPVGIALDMSVGKMYWTDRDKLSVSDPEARSSIHRANLDGTNIETLVLGGNSIKEHIALDTSGGKIYWTDWGNFSDDKIQRANLDGSNVEDLVTGLNNPRGIALDVSQRKMYWTNDGKIQCANLDGSNIQDLLIAGPRQSGIALDVASGKIYWADQNSNKIRRANLDGTNVEDVVALPGLPVDIDLDSISGKMYWTAFRPSKIQRANLDGTNVEDLITIGLSNPIGIALGIPQPSGTITFSPSEIADQTFTVGTYASLTLPIATGGTAPYTYSISALPPGLHFDPVDRWLNGTPTTLVNAHPVTYTATDATGASASLTFTITVELNLDVNSDGQVNVLDLVWVAVSYGMRGTGLPADVNADGIVNIQDLVAVAAGIDAGTVLPTKIAEEVLLAAALDGAAGAPVIGFNTRSEALSGVTAYRNVANALADAKHLAIDDVRLGEGVALLETLLQVLAEMKAIPETTALLPNYPNPFNPETWIPYHLATDADVTLTIYNIRGVAVRQLVLGHQSAGVYESRGRAAYWDGRNQLGEPVASGLYFYTLTAGDFTATRKLLIAK